jgi:hypothetical protein
MKNITYITIYILIAIFLITGCKKQDDFLDAKPNDALALPNTLQNLQLLIQNEGVFNSQSYPGLGELSTDDYYTTDALWASQQSIQRNAYIWAKVIEDPSSPYEDLDWSESYNQVYNANVVLENLAKLSVTAGQQSQFNMIKGSALFFRAIAFYGLVQTFALPYDSGTAGTDPGIPLRLSSDINLKYGRSSVADSYKQILQDLQLALPLLPAKQSQITLPSKAAVYGLLSRLYLAMGNYDQSLTNAANCLNLQNTLQDFNKLTPGSFVPYPHFSPEDVFHCSFVGYGIAFSYSSHVDSNLYKLFNNPNDLRPGVFFRFRAGGLITFLGQFDYQTNIYSGISVNEMYLTKAECEARSGDAADAMTDLNTLLETRWKTGTFVPYQATSADDALIQILTERRKELVLTGIRWTDLRRLNKDSRFAVTLKRVVNGTAYTLPPNDPRYALPIPNIEIQLSGIQQNQR